MSKILHVTYEEKPCYDIMIESNFAELFTRIAQMDLKNRKICIVSDSNVAKNYLEEVENGLKPYVGTVCHYVFEAGEKQKHLGTIEEIYQVLIDHQFDRKDYLLALGGGVTGDMTGYASATYLRGISFIQVPTSLLSQVDSSIGGKTGVDFRCYKNMVGAFKQPSLVYINTSTLNSMDKREYLSGMGEIIKHGYIKNSAYLAWIRENVDKILARDAATLEEMIYESCKVKQDVVQRDPLEKGERALLNFGHTIGHSIEKCMDFKLLHGECVVLGMIAALEMSRIKGNITEQEVADAIALFEKLEFAVKMDKSLDVATVLETTKLDKKMDSGSIRFILLSEIGNGIISNSVTMEDMEKGLRCIL